MAVFSRGQPHNKSKSNFEKIWHRFENVDQRLLQVEAALTTTTAKNHSKKTAQANELFRERLHMVPNMATGQYFILQLVNRFGFDIAEIASWCNLPPLTVFGIYQGKGKRWSSDTVFERLLRFYCVVLRHNLQPSQKSVLH